MRALINLPRRTDMNEEVDLEGNVSLHENLYVCLIENRPGWRKLIEEIVGWIILNE